MCGIFGLIGHKEAARLTYLGLYALQHRGEESAGIVSLNGNNLHQHRGMGLVCDVFDESSIKTLKGNIAIGHVRYSTTGASLSKNTQPFVVNRKGGHIVIAHNGNIVNTVALRDSMEKNGSIFQTTMDSEIIAHLIAGAKNKDVVESVVEALSKIEGAYSLVLLVNGVLIGARDPYGFRPLCLGKYNGGYALSSETCALDLIKAKYVRDVEPGEIVFITKDSIKSIKPFPKKRKAFCVFEYIYFARPDSNIFGHNVYAARKQLGINLAKESKVGADFIMPVPDSGTYAAIGFSQAKKIPLEMGMIRNHYVGRTFIQPTQDMREFRVRVKLNPVRDLFKGKEIIVIEDSIVRGSTSRVRIKALRLVGAKKIHMCVSCPPLKYPCFFGIDFPTKEELIAAGHSLEWIREFIGLDTLTYLSQEAMLKSMPLPKESFCTACFDGNYPLKVPGDIAKLAFEC